MTRREFDDCVTGFYDLKCFCLDEDCDICDDIYDEDEISEYIENQIQVKSTRVSWREIRDWLDDIPTNTYFYRIDDEDDSISDAEYYFDDYKDNVFDWCLENDIFEAEEEEAIDAPEMPAREEHSREEYLEEEDNVEIEEPDAQVLYTLFSESAKHLQVIKASQPVEAAKEEPEDDAMWFA